MSAASIRICDGEHVAEMGFGHTLTFGSPVESADGFLECLRKDKWPEGWSANMGDGADFRPFLKKRLQQTIYLPPYYRSFLTAD